MPSIVGLRWHSNELDNEYDQGCELVIDHDDEQHNFNDTPANTAAPANTSETAKSDTASPNTGVPECDEYITKFEACMTTIAAKNPQIEPTMKSSFEAQCSAIKAGASTPQG